MQNGENKLANERISLHATKLIGNSKAKVTETATTATTPHLTTFASMPEFHSPENDLVHLPVNSKLHPETSTANDYVDRDEQSSNSRPTARRDAAFSMPAALSQNDNDTIENVHFLSTWSRRRRKKRAECKEEGLGCTCFEGVGSVF